MKKIILVLMVLPVLLTGCFEKIPLSEVKACESNEECIMVPGGGCCNCKISINSEYEGYWEKWLEQPIDCHLVDCIPCYDGEQEAVCENNQCRLIPVELEG